MNVIVFSPHPDDAEAQMGGTIAKHTQAGHDVLMVVVTVPNNKETRIEEAGQAARLLGAKLKILDLDPDTLAFDRKLVGVFDQVLKGFPPDAIYTCWLHDSHQDHVSVSLATIAAARRNRCSLYMYNQALPSGITPHDFHPQLFVDISDTIEKKMEAVQAHRSQVDAFGEAWLQGIRAAAVYTGFQINVACAESFEVIKEINNF
jgi:LmbE family N-acetylglucosaminyl deacetylase